MSEVLKPIRQASQLNDLFEVGGPRSRQTLDGAKGDEPISDEIGYS
jgi:hypothetical protein